MLYRKLNFLRKITINLKKYIDINVYVSHVQNISL